MERVSVMRDDTAPARHGSGYPSTMERGKQDDQEHIHEARTAAVVQFPHQPAFSFLLFMSPTFPSEMLLLSTTRHRRSSPFSSSSTSDVSLLLPRNLHYYSQKPIENAFVLISAFGTWLVKLVIFAPSLRTLAFSSPSLVFRSHISKYPLF